MAHDLRMASQTCMTDTLKATTLLPAFVPLAGISKACDRIADTVDRHVEGDSAPGAGHSWIASAACEHYQLGQQHHTH